MKKHSERDTLVLIWTVYYDEEFISEQLINGEITEDEIPDMVAYETLKLFKGN